MAVQAGGYRNIPCQRPGCRGVLPTIRDLASHLAIHDLDPRRTRLDDPSAHAPSRNPLLIPAYWTVTQHTRLDLRTTHLWTWVIPLKAGDGAVPSAPQLPTRAPDAPIAVRLLFARLASSHVTDRQPSQPSFADTSPSSLLLACPITTMTTTSEFARLRFVCAVCLTYLCCCCCCCCAEHMLPTLPL